MTNVLGYQGILLIYINDIVEVINDNRDLRLFADDALIYATGYSSEEINNKLNMHMIKLEIKRLKPNVDKMKVMLIRGVRKKIKYEQCKN